MQICFLCAVTLEKGQVYVEQGDINGTIKLLFDEIDSAHTCNLVLRDRIGNGARA